MGVGGETIVLNTGDAMPFVGLGTWLAESGKVGGAVKHALKVGYRHIDCAAIYRNEEEVGSALKEAMAELAIARKDVFVTSKLWNAFHHPDDVESACRKTLSDLQLDHLDLYLMHWPTAFARGEGLFPKNEDGSLKYDGDLHPSETWAEMEKLVEKGLCKAIGLSNCNSLQIQDILDKGKIKPANLQIECHPYFNQSKLVKFCQDRGISVTAYSPLGSPQRPWAKPGESSVLEEPKLVEMAKKKGKTPAQILIRFQVQRGIAVIPKSVNPSRIEENLDVFDFALDEDEMKVLLSFDCNRRMVVPMTEDGKFRDASHKHFPFLVEF